MAKVPPPRGKGEPPTPVETVGNLEKPESEALVTMNFKVPTSFRREFKIMAAQRDKDMVEQLYEAFALLQEKEKANHEGTK